MGGKLIIDSVVVAARQGMEPMVGPRYVFPYFLLEFVPLLIGSVAGQRRSLSDRMLQSQLTNHVNGVMIRSDGARVIMLSEAPLPQPCSRS